MHRTRAISWTDGDTPEWQDKGCKLTLMRFAACAALVLSALALAGGSVWSGRGPDAPPPAPPVDDGPEDNWGGWRTRTGRA